VKRFNITGPCIPELHYMADITDKLNAVRKMIDYGDYFTINRARQYGKTTMLQAIERTCSITYLVLRISFEGLGESVFSSEHRFIDSFTKLIFKELEYHNAAQYLLDIWNTDLIKSDFHELGNKITSLNKSSDKKILLLIDEVDKYSDNQVFLDFLGLLRTLYLDRMKRVTFHSIILTGVYDIKILSSNERMEKTNVRIHLGI